MAELELHIARAIKARATSRKARRKAVAQLLNLSKERASE